MMMVSQFNGTSTPKGHTVPKPVIMIATSIQVATVQELCTLCESIRYQAKSEQNVRQDLGSVS